MKLYIMLRFGKNHEDGIAKQIRGGRGVWPCARSLWQSYQQEAGQSLDSYVVAPYCGTKL